MDSDSDPHFVTSRSTFARASKSLLGSVFFTTISISGLTTPSRSLLLLFLLRIFVFPKFHGSIVTPLHFEGFPDTRSFNFVAAAKSKGHAVNGSFYGSVYKGTGN